MLEEELAITFEMKNVCVQRACGVVVRLGWLNPGAPFVSRYGSVYVRIKGYQIRFSDHRSKKRRNSTKWVFYCHRPYCSKKYEYGLKQEDEMIKDIEKFFKERGHERPKDYTTE